MYPTKAFDYVGHTIRIPIFNAMVEVFADFTYKYNIHLNLGLSRMGAGERHGRRRAGRRRRRQRRAHHHNRHHHNHHNHHIHHRTNRVPVHHPLYYQSVLGAVSRQRSQGAPNSSCSSTSNTNTNTDTIIGIFASSMSTPAPPVRQTSSTFQCLSMCRVTSIFLWFVGIMMMSLGGFQTPIGFIGLGILFLGIFFLCLTSLAMSGSCSKYCNRTMDPERPPTWATENGHHVPNQRSTAPVPNPSFATSYADPSPAYARGAHFDAVVRGAVAKLHQCAAVPFKHSSSSDLGMVCRADPHPSNTPKLDHRMVGRVEPYPSSADTQSFQQTGSGTNYTWGAASYPSQQVTGSSVPQQDTVGVSVAAGTTPQTVLTSHLRQSSPFSVQVVNEYPSVSVQHHTVLSTPRADDSSTLTATTIPPEPATPSADTLPTVQVETFNELPLSSSMNSQTELPLLDQAMHGCNRTSLDTSNALATHVKVESSLLEGEEEGDVGGELDGDEIGTRDEPSSTNSALPPVSSPLPVMAQSEC
ncbi:hypothetical protein BSL78_16166 [Apostichopus japonicus]|uniref:Uncharacterized protein n=1 Tax=Stichopus japonicus TaxID=307972 RepID=A0A2G8KG49_STIJA|nr:hypothetical protein BSL78_16166 [Apostichopus japonicus]